MPTGKSIIPADICVTPEVYKSVVPKRISYNRIFLHSNCPLMYYLSYSTPWGERPRPSVDKVYKGAIWHQYMEDWEKGKIPNDATFDELHLAKVCSSQYRQFNTAGWPAPGSYITEMSRIIKKGFEWREANGLMEKGLAEVTFKADIGIPGVTISGRIDRIGTSEGGTIIDFKTKGGGADMFQLKCYLVGMRRDPRWPTQGKALFLYANGKTDEIDTTKNSRAMDYIEAEVKARIEKFLVSVQQGCRDGKWTPMIGRYCSWCVYKKDCPEQKAMLAGKVSL